MMQDIQVLLKDEMKPIRCYGTSFFKICCSEYLITLWFLTIQSIDYSSTPQTKSLSWSLHQESLNQMEFAKNVTKLQRSKGHFSGSLRRRVMKDDTVRNAKTGKDAPGAFSWAVWRRAMPCSLIGWDHFCPALSLDRNEIRPCLGIMQPNSIKVAPFYGDQL